jgi:hypothetical protein
VRTVVPPVSSRVTNDANRAIAKKTANSRPRDIQWIVSKPTARHNGTFVLCGPVFVSPTIPVAENTHVASQFSGIESQDGRRFLEVFAFAHSPASFALNFAMRSINFTGTGSAREKRTVAFLIWRGVSSSLKAASIAPVAG